MHGVVLDARLTCWPMSCDLQDGQRVPCTPGCKRRQQCVSIGLADAEQATHAQVPRYLVQGRPALRGSLQCQHNNTYRY